MQSYNELQVEVTKAVNDLKTKIVCAVIFAIIKICKNEKRSIVEYTKSLQRKFIMKNQDSLNPDIVQRNLEVWQEEAVDKIQKVLPFKMSRTQHLDTYCDSQNSSSSGGSLEWFETEVPDNEHPKNKSVNIITSCLRKNFGMEDSVTKNAAFLESILRLTEACKEKSAESTSDLHSVLYDKASITNFCMDSSVVCKKKRLTEDSGLGYSEGYIAESSSDMGLVQSDVVRYALYSTNTSDPVTLSLSAVVNVFKTKLYSDCEEMFYGWEGSFYQYICNVIAKCSQLNTDCREVVVNLITQVIGDCWHERKPVSHQLTTMKINIIEKLVWDYGVCNEVNQNVIEQISMFNLYLSKNQKDVNILVQRIGIILSLYCSTCEKIVKHNRICITGKSGGSKLKMEMSQECAVSEFWMNQLCPKDQEGDGLDLTPPVNERDIEVLECLIISVINKYPLIYGPAVEALNAARRLNEVNLVHLVQCVI